MLIQDYLRHVKGNAYGRQEEIYRCEDCSGCPCAERCRKGDQNRTVRILTVFKYACYALLLFLIIEMIYLMPVMACFEDTIPHLLRNALFFASRRPLKMLLAAAIHIVPAVITVIDTYLRPLYGFLWTVCGFGLIAMMMAELLIRDFEEFLPKTEEEEQIPKKPSKTRRAILKEMKKLDQ